MKIIMHLAIILQLTSNLIMAMVVDEVKHDKKKNNYYKFCYYSDSFNLFNS